MFEKILSKIRPIKKEEQEVSLNVNEFLNTLNSKLKNAKAIVCGSFAKGTWLSGQHDIDIFVLFDDNKDMSERLEKSLKLCFKKYEKIHGSRDYFIVDFKNLSFELIPVLKIKKAEDAQNITDVSPMHVDWIRKNIKNLANDVLLTKEFLKVNGFYGAETYVGGFSGYLVELLVIYCGGFMNFIKNSAKLKEGTLIHFGKNWFHSEQEFPLVVIDPVQPNRNTAAALRNDKFLDFIDLCKKFISKPSAKFFVEKKIDLKSYDLVFKVEPLSGSKDVAGTKMLKAFEKIKNELDKEFGVKDSGWFWKEHGCFYFKVKNKKLDKFRKHFGPPLRLEKDTIKFRNKYEKFKVNIENNRSFVMLSRDIVNLKDFTKFILKNKEIKERVKSIKPGSPKAI